MVLQLQFWRRARLENLGIAATVLAVLLSTTSADAAPAKGPLQDVAQYYRSGQYFKSARYAFSAFQKNPAIKPEAYAWLTLSLLQAGLPHSASYFFIRTLQTQHTASIRSVLTQTERLIVSVGADILRKYLVRHTKYEDYDQKNRSAYLYALGKDALISGDESRAVGYFKAIQTTSPLWPYALQMKGTALAILGQNESAVRDFRMCADRADQLAQYYKKEVPGENQAKARQAELEADDLRYRCVASEARTLYQQERFEEADRVYDRIAKQSFVWPDILFEQAWNAFSRGEYNKSLGKLVSYKSPALGFVFNSEIDVLRAQSFLALCQYSDANDVINEFHSKYTSTGEQIKDFVESNSSHLNVFFDTGKAALRASLYTNNGMYQMMNRFIRGPYFQNLVSDEKEIARERVTMARYDSQTRGAAPQSGLLGFLNEVLKWRLRTVQILGGAFIKNSLIEYHTALIEDYEKMAFIKLEMLRFAKDKLVYKATPGGDRARGNIVPARRDDQYRWSFNGEFWNDELGDYVFGLESEC